MNDQDTLGILLIETNLNEENSIYNIDSEIIVITDNSEAPLLKHYEITNKSIELQYVYRADINRVLISGNNRKLIEWLSNGEVVYDKDNFVMNLRKRIKEFPINDRKYKMAVEFSKLIRRYMDGKKLFHNGDFLDAFNCILHSLHHLARLSVIEHGYYPEVTVWKQVKQIEPEIYKLYDEMILGEESLKKRLELLLIANNFALTSKTKLGASHLIEVMRQSKEPWSIEQLINHPEIKEYALDLTVLIDYLVQKGIIDIIKMETLDDNVFNRFYYVK